MVCSITRLLRAGARASKAFIYKNNDNLSVIAISASKRKSELLFVASVRCQAAERKKRKRIECHRSHIRHPKNSMFRGKWLSFRFARIYWAHFDEMPRRKRMNGNDSFRWLHVTWPHFARRKISPFLIHHLSQLAFAIMDEIFIVCLLHPAPVSFCIHSIWTTRAGPTAANCEAQSVGGKWWTILC